jgi:DNA-binding MarR family transcriptional regulator
MATKVENSAGACAYVVGDDGLSRWNDASASAWIGLLETHRQLTRELDAELQAASGVGLSELELLGRLAAADGRRLRMSALAAASGLSLSRVSRIVDALERRGLVERQPCPGDARAINARLTDGGLELARAAQATHFAGVQRRFFDRLSADEVGVLAAVFSRFTPRAAEECGPVDD